MCSITKVKPYSSSNICESKSSFVYKLQAKQLLCTRFLSNNEASF